MTPNPLREWISKSDKYKSAKQFFDTNNLSLGMYCRLCSHDPLALKNTRAHTLEHIKRLTDGEVDLYAWYAQSHGA